MSGVHPDLSNNNYITSLMLTMLKISAVVYGIQQVCVCVCVNLQPFQLHISIEHSSAQRSTFHKSMPHIARESSSENKRWLPALLFISYPYWLHFMTWCVFLLQEPFEELWHFKHVSIGGTSVHFSVESSILNSIDLSNVLMSPLIQNKGLFMGHF